MDQISMVEVNVEVPIAAIILNREQKLNALNTNLYLELYDILRQLENNKEVCAIIITGRGKAFSAGADIYEFYNMDQQKFAEFLKIARMVYDFIENMNKLVISAVNGYCLGGGFELALAGDFIIATKDALFGFPEIRLGLIPGSGGTQRLTRIVGRNKAKEIILSGRFITAEEAEMLNIVNKIVNNEALLEEAKKLASDICKFSYNAIYKAKRAINEGIESPISTSLSFEIELAINLFNHDVKKKIESFIYKKKEGRIT
ncbi:Enoyl-CoA hydratase [Saccharolobus shibatae B12]|uniref:Enoyl-CoA hydratase n=1 Tax=Saccharolobus shibatae (strain ATCC 51178 / DSM 5389 / JCM 8931 / NBRC 15437 / B12) TaxID=523848 RepID=A0A8F5BLZ7_SACSH|nr:enoyl-CoA hydratase/isomerase family protein [Saccharolobus shibatae]QXJ27566.1 Enoyl-CoA hydratase [Saccharolobus shibatae B12]